MLWLHSKGIINIIVNISTNYQLASIVYYLVGSISMLYLLHIIFSTHHLFQIHIKYTFLYKLLFYFFVTSMRQIVYQSISLVIITFEEVYIKNVIRSFRIFTTKRKKINYLLTISVLNIKSTSITFMWQQQGEGSGIDKLAKIYQK